MPYQRPSPKKYRVVQTIQVVHDTLAFSPEEAEDNAYKTTANRFRSTQQGKYAPFSVESVEVRELTPEEQAQQMAEIKTAIQQAPIAAVVEEAS